MTTQDWMTAEWAVRQAQRMERDAARLRELAESLSNPGLLPDEREAVIDEWRDREAS